jgi:L,D-peptidoglycan transpeptidase YkuD (ErfK/YbiS/YcfS/YnhG family)
VTSSFNPVCVSTARPKIILLWIASNLWKPFTVICCHPQSYPKKRERKGRPDDSRRKPAILAVRPRPGRRSEGLVGVGGAVFPCALGRGGITAGKREGDGGTPLGDLRVLWGYHRPGRGFPPRTPLSLLPTFPTLGWCDAPGDRNYNRPVRLPYPASSETMQRTDRLYDVVLVLDWNMRPAIRGRGSAIFLHIAREGYAPTEGCIAVSPATMRRLLPLLRCGSVVRVMR